MGRGIQTTQSNPATKWIEWNGSKGHFYYYDKLEEKDVVLESLVFLVLDKVGAITGWHEASSSGIFSNQVRNTRDEVFSVKAFNQQDPLAEGVWASIKDMVKAKGGKFTANIYSAIKTEDGTLETVCIQFKGAALNAWTEFQKKAGENINTMAVKWSGNKEGKKGAIVYQMPEFSLVKVSDETNDEANKLYEELKVYLTAATANNVTIQTSPQEDKPVQMDEKKTLSFADPAFPNIMANLSSGQTTLIDVKRKYDMEKPVEDALRSAEQAATVGVEDMEDEAPEAEPTPAPLDQSIDDLDDADDDLPF